VEGLIPAAAVRLELELAALDLDGVEPAAVGRAAAVEVAPTGAATATGPGPDTTAGLFVTSGTAPFWAPGSAGGTCPAGPLGRGCGRDPDTPDVSLGGNGT
jgi:hypothetical protein